MEIKLTLNGKPLTAEIDADTLLIDFVRDHGCLSVKRGCETANCGLCTVLLDGTPVLSCSMLAARAAGHQVQTLEGLQEEAEDFVGFIADQGAEQCGFCNPGFVMNTIALLRENPDPTDDEIRAYLAGNLCRCSGYEGQLRGIDVYKRQANGCAAMGLCQIIEAAHAKVAGIGIVIEKGFQCGGKMLREKGLRVESLAIVDGMDAATQTVRFRDD